MNNTKAEYPEYRISRSKKVRIIKILVILIVTLWFFAYSSYSGLELVSDKSNDGLFLLFMVFLIAIVATNLQSRRIVVNKDGIYRISSKKRIFIPWQRIISISYVTLSKNESLKIVVKDNKNKKLLHPIASFTYTWDLPYYYPIELFDGHHLCLGTNKELEECLWYYCNLYKVKYEFVKRFTKRVRYR